MSCFKEKKAEKVSLLAILFLILLQKVTTPVESLKSSNFFFCVENKTTWQKSLNKERLLCQKTKSKKRITFNSEVIFCLQAGISGARNFNCCCFFLTKIEQKLKCFFQKERFS
jgi:hypothetical protein